jgi:D-alanine-D-alanine ligase
VKAGKEIDFDAAFPILHGPMGEDGTMQGLLELCAIPYVGCGVLASAVGMDKEVCKLLAREAGLPVLKHIVLDRADFSVSRAEKQVEALGYPVFVKPMCMGSSVGITKVDAPSELEAAVLKAFEYDRRVMVEKGVSHAREIMCAVLGSGDDVTASVCGEVRPVNHEFFDYESKYEDERGMEFTLPAKIPEDLSERIRALSVTVFRAIRGEGFARVDFLLHPETGELYFGEINTAPGFTSHSLYPRLFAESGIKPADAVCRLLHIAFKRQEESKHTSVYR